MVISWNLQKSDNFYCQPCDVLCSHRNEYILHFLTREHKMVKNGNKMVKNDNGPLKKGGEKNNVFFHCKKCDVICSNQSNYNRHLLTRQHFCPKGGGVETKRRGRAEENNEQLSNYCEMCDVICSNKQNYKRHLLTFKHCEKKDNFDEKKDEHCKNSICSYFCEICHVLCSNKPNYKRHLLTKKHLAKENEKVRLNVFKCEICDTVCSDETNYDTHILSHQVLSTKNDNNPTAYSCHCGKQYKHKSGLSRHKSVCTIPKKDDSKINEQATGELTNAVVCSYNYSNGHIIVPPYNPHPQQELSENTKFFMDIIKDNQDFKNLLIEQHKTMLELVQNSQHIYIANNSTITTNTNSNNTNSGNIMTNSCNTTNLYNKQFNLNYFLNEQCKNAINLTEFVDNLDIDLNDLENVADKGYVEGITQIFMNGLKKLDIYTRPVHCTDIKRETVHVRENSVWVKDTRDQTKIKAAIRRTAFRNIQQISKWNNKHPQFRILDTNDFKRSFQIMKQSLGNTVPGGVEKNDEKIAKNIIKAIYVDKKDPMLLCM